MAQACLVMYRMGGLRHVILYLHDLLHTELSLSRINTVYCYRDASTIINMADTNEVSVSNKFASSSPFHPIICGDQLETPLILNDLRTYQNDFTAHGNPLWADMPYLHHKALLRIPLFINDENVFLINFWSDTGQFDNESITLLEELLAPLAEELSINLSGMKLHGAKPSTPSVMGVVNKLELCPSLFNVRQAVKSAAPTDFPLLLLGETGVGKEVVAEALYQESLRSKKPFIRVNCGAIPEDLIDSELFGHEKGAFTGAIATKRGYFEMADEGTLFLDEIGEMSLASQVRLLRVLDTGMIRRVGGSREFSVDVRIIAATHDDLPRKVQEGKFRQDLWYRLSVLPIHIPPLRKRLDDIPALVKMFVESNTHKLGLSSYPFVSEEEIRGLLQHLWPGNVRELKNVVDRAMIKFRQAQWTDGLHFELMNLPETYKAAPESPPSAEKKMLWREDEWPTLKEMENRYIKAVLGHCKGKLTGADSATSLLDIHYTTLKTRMRQMGLTVEGD